MGGKMKNGFCAGFSVLGEEYAKVRGFDKEKCIRLILEATKKQNK